MRNVFSLKLLNLYLGFMKLPSNMISGDVAMVTKGIPPLT